MNPRTILVTFCLVTGLALISQAQAPDLSQMDLVERAVPAGPVAMVDGTAIPRKAFLFLYKSQLAAREHANPSVAIAQADRVRLALLSLGDLLRREIVYKEGQRRGITAPETEVVEAFEQEMEAMQKYMTRPGEAPPSREELLERLGQDESDAMRQIAKSLVVQGTEKAIASERKVTVSTEEARRFYDARIELFQRPESIHLEHVFVRTPGEKGKTTDANWEEARKRINKALARIRAGERFGKVAEDMSDAPDATQQGDLGVRPKAALPPYYLEAAAKLKVDDISEPIRSSLGYHIIRLVATEAGEAVPFEKARPAIVKDLQALKSSGVIDEFVQPIVNDPDRVQVFLQLQKSLADVPGLEMLSEK